MKHVSPAVSCGIWPPVALAFMDERVHKKTGCSAASTMIKSCHRADLLIQTEEQEYYSVAANQIIGLQHGLGLVILKEYIIS
jgi:hypothetical protein